VGTAARAQRTTGGGSGAARREAGPPPHALLALQRSAGNRAVGGAVQREKLTREQLLDGPLPPVGHPQRDQAVRLRILRSQGKLKAPKGPTLMGTLGSIWNALPSFGSWSYGEDEEEEPEAKEHGLGHDDLELAKGEGSDHTGEKQLGAQEKEEAQEALEAFTPKQITITIASAAGSKKGTRVGDVSGSSNLDVTGDGGTSGEAKGKVEGGYGKGEGELKAKVGQEAIEGAGKVEFLLGGSSEQKTGTLAYNVHGHALEGNGSLESFGGLKGGLEAKGRYDRTTGDITGKAKGGAMVGVGTEGTVTIKLQKDGKELGSYQGKAGMHFGLGGEIFGEIEWKGGKLSLDTGGKVAFGLGVSYGYKLQLNTTSVMEAATSYLSSFFSWMGEGMTEEDFWL
jgi:hypothetical protein